MSDTIYEISGVELDNLKSAFFSADDDSNGYLELKELRSALKLVGFDMPGYEVRKMEDDFKRSDSNRDGKLSIQEFQNLYSKLKCDEETRSSFKTLIRPMNTDVKILKKNGGDSLQSQHFIKDSEKEAFCKWINQNLSEDPDLNLTSKPLIPDGSDLFERCAKNSLLLCKLINLCVPSTIDERSLNRTKNISIYQELENHELALRSAEAIGCHIVNIRAKDIQDGKEHLILGLMWQTIQIGLFSDINLISHPGLMRILSEEETQDDLIRLTAEEILIRWVNYHLNNSGYIGQGITNFNEDIKNSIAYVYLLDQVAPQDLECPITLGPLNEGDLLKRAEMMLVEAEKLKCREFVNAGEIVRGHQKLNMAFVANLFNNYPALDVFDSEMPIIVEETREEKTFRNWMNSLGVKPKVNYLYSDLQDCLVIFQLYDMIKPGCVDWNRVIKTFAANRQKFQKLDNCNYAIEIGRGVMGFKLVGIQGSNLLEGNKLFFLALMSQLMRAYVLSLLEKLAGEGDSIGDREIIEWANQKLKSADKNTSILSFQDKSIRDSLIVCDLVDSIRPGSVKYDHIKLDNSNEAWMDNARYAISLARKVGARVFALPEDIVEVKPKMVMTVFATLMILDFQSTKA